MVLNLSDKQVTDFSVSQRLALRGRKVLTTTHPVLVPDDYDYFDAYLSRYENVIELIIVGKRIDTVLANDIINSVDVPVVTLDVEFISDDSSYNFIEYGETE